MKGDKKEESERMTTIRARVTECEHDAVRWYARVKLGQTIDEFVKNAIDLHISSLSGKSMSVLAEESKTRGKLVQEELF